MGQADGKCFVVLQSFVVGTDLAVCQSQDETLERLHGIVHEDQLKRSQPLLFACSHLVQVWILCRESSDAEDQIQLCQLVMALDLVGFCDPVLIDAQEGRLVKDREQRSPFLEVDVDASV